MSSQKNIPLIDSHAHLDFDRFDDDRSDVIDRARRAGVYAILSIGTDIASSQRAVDLAGQNDMLYASAGIHPHQADDFQDDEWATLRGMWTMPQVKGIGETGLDYYYDYSDRDRQCLLFEQHLQAAYEFKLPVIIHIRDAFDDAFRLIKDVGIPAGGVVHCFTGGPDECARALDLGLHISLSGIVTFKNAKALRAAVPTIPIDRLLVETDSPFLAPVPYRGKRNEPAFVRETAMEVAALREVSFEVLAEATCKNTHELFNLPVN